MWTQMTAWELGNSELGKTFWKGWLLGYRMSNSLQRGGPGGPGGLLVNRGKWEPHKPRNKAGSRSTVMCEGWGREQTFSCSWSINCQSRRKGWKREVRTRSWKASGAPLHILPCSAYHKKVQTFQSLYIQGPLGSGSAHFSKFKSLGHAQIDRDSSTPEIPWMHRRCPVTELCSHRSQCLKQSYSSFMW